MGESKRRREFYQQTPNQRLGDGPVDAEYHAQMTALVSVIDEFFNGNDQSEARKTGFVLMVFPYGNVSGRCNYMSNGADRKDVVLLMKEMIARFSGQPECVVGTRLYWAFVLDCVHDESAALLSIKG